MPLYEWICEECNHEFETYQKMSKDAPMCDKCKGACRKLISRSSFRLPGDGWANQGYQKKKE